VCLGVVVGEDSQGIVFHLCPLDREAVELEPVLQLYSSIPLPLLKPQSRLSEPFSTLIFPSLQPNSY